MISRVRSICVLLLFATAASVCVWLRLSVGRDLAQDFTAFYLAGRVPPASLYDRQVFTEYGKTLLRPLGIDYYPPYVRPAVFAVPLRLLTWLPYWTAFRLWVFILFVSYVSALGLAFYIRRPSLPTILLFAIFAPALIGPTLGQDADMLAFIIGLSILLALLRKDVASGAVLACGLYKFNLIAFLPFVFLLHRRTAAFIAFCAVGLLLALASVAITPPAAYLALLSHVLDYTQVPVQHFFGVRGLAAGIGMPWLYYVSLAALGITVLVAIRRLSLLEAFIVAAIAGLLLAYQATWWDTAMLTAPLWMLMSDRSVAVQAGSIVVVCFVGWIPIQLLPCLALLFICGLLVARAFRKPTASTQSSELPHAASSAES